MAEAVASRRAGTRATATVRRPRRTKIGRVTSNKMDKTIVVAVEMVTRHRLYGRTLRRSRHFKVHDEGNRCEIGDTVIIAESRPISKDKHWTVQQIIRRGTGEPVDIAEVEA